MHSRNLIPLSPVLVILLFATFLPGSALATASFYAALGAEVELLDRSSDVWVIGPEVASDSSAAHDGQGDFVFGSTHHADALTIAQTAFLRAQVDGESVWAGTGDPANLQIRATADATFGLANRTPDPVSVDVMIRIPGRRFPTAELNEYRFEGAVTQDSSEVAEVNMWVQIRVDPGVTGVSTEGDTFALETMQSTRNDGVGTVFSAHGLAFPQTFTLTLPPAEGGRAPFFNVYVRVFVGAKALSSWTSSTSLPLINIPPNPLEPAAAPPAPSWAQPDFDIPMFSMLFRLLLIAAILLLGLLSLQQKQEKSRRKKQGHP